MSMSSQAIFAQVHAWAQAIFLLEGQRVAAFLPNILAPGKTSRMFVRIRIPELDARVFAFHLAWNSRLLRLNPHAIRCRDLLAESLAMAMKR